MLESSRTGIGTLSVLELNIWRKGEDSLVVASPPIKFHKREFSQGALLINDADEVSENNVGTTQKRDPVQTEQNRLFWDDFISSCEFDHPDQDPPRRQNVNSVRLPFPSPVGWVTCFRISSGKKRIGIFMYFDGDEAEKIFHVIQENESELQKTIPELQIGLGKDYKKGKPTVFMTKELDVTDPSTLQEQKDWLLTNIRTWVNLFRPFLKTQVD